MGSAVGTKLKTMAPSFKNLSKANSSAIGDRALQTSLTPMTDCWLGQFGANSEAETIVAIEFMIAMAI